MARFFASSAGTVVASACRRSRRDALARDCRLRVGEARPGSPSSVGTASGPAAPAVSSAAPTASAPGASPTEVQSDVNLAFGRAGRSLLPRLERFADGGAIPAQLTCDGANGSPPLAWTGVPAGTAALALLVDDPDAGDFTHWIVLDLPGADGSLPGGVAPAAATPVQGTNNFGKVGWGGPCPPSGTHHYRFTLTALGAPLGLDDHLRGDVVRAALAKATVLGTATLTGTYGGAERRAGGCLQRRPSPQKSVVKDFCRNRWTDARRIRHRCGDVVGRGKPAQRGLLYDRFADLASIQRFDSGNRSAMTSRCACSLKSPVVTKAPTQPRSKTRHCSSQVQATRDRGGALLTHFAWPRTTSFH